MSAYPEIVIRRLSERVFHIEEGFLVQCIEESVVEIHEAGGELDWSNGTALQAAPPRAVVPRFECGRSRRQTYFGFERAGRRTGRSQNRAPLNARRRTPIVSFTSAARTRSRGSNLHLPDASRRPPRRPLETARSAGWPWSLSDASMPDDEGDTESPLDESPLLGLPAFDAARFFLSMTRMLPFVPDPRRKRSRRWNFSSARWSFCGAVGLFSKKDGRRSWTSKLPGMFTLIARRRRAAASGFQRESGVVLLSVACPFISRRRP